MSFGQKYGRASWPIYRCSAALIAVLSLNSFVIQGYAAEPTSPPLEEAIDAKVNMPLDAQYANWIFSGAVSSENGETYEYFFQAKRKQNQVQATVSLVDAQTKSVIFIKSSEIKLSDPHAANWEIGDIFLRYNTINRSWVFGLKQTNQVGFNFKVDTIHPSERAPKIQKIQRGVTMSVVQTGQVNGHIQLTENGSAQFVSGKNAWFREVLMQETTTKSPLIQGLLCRFDDGSGLYSMKMGRKPFWRKTISGSYDAEGVAAAVSKFIHVEQLKSDLWRVNVPHSKFQFELSDVLQDQTLVLGFVDKKQSTGFCVISKDDALV